MTLELKFGGYQGDKSVHTRGGRVLAEAVAEETGGAERVFRALGFDPMAIDVRDLPVTALSCRAGPAPQRPRSLQTARFAGNERAPSPRSGRSK